MENKATLEVIKFLVAQDPEVMKLDKYKLGKSPVHVAANRGAPVEVVQYLLQQRPEAIAEKDVWGKTPLACACAAIPVVDNDDDSKNAVASKNDDEHNDDDNKRSINDKVTSDNDGDDNDNKEINNKELSNNKIKDKDNSLAILRLLTDSARIAEPDRGGMLPLHIACVSGASVEIIAQLLDEYREAIRLPDNNGRLPLHAACMNPRVNLDALDLLHKAYPAALRIFDKTGSVPLHIAIQRKLSASVVHFLIDKEEGAVRTREASSKMYPLHLACRVGADVDVLERLVEIYPVAIEAVDARGNSIFHLACTYRQLTVDFAELLLDKCSFDTIRKVNEEQSLPLHLAVQYKAAMPVLQLLIDHYPEALLCKDTKGNVPLHKAFQNLTPMPILVRLAQQNHHALCRRNNRGDTPMECAPLLLQKQFKRARYWYNLRKAYCPICIRMK